MPTTSSLSHSADIVIRRALEADRRDIADLAALDSARPPRGDVLVAEIAGEPWAALSLEDGHTVADPFRRSGALVDLLRARAAQHPHVREGRPLLAPRWAA